MPRHVILFDKRYRRVAGRKVRGQEKLSLPESAWHAGWRSKGACFQYAVSWRHDLKGGEPQ